MMNELIELLNEYYDEYYIEFENDFEKWYDIRIKVKSFKDELWYDELHDEINDIDDINDIIIYDLDDDYDEILIEKRND